MWIAEAIARPPLVRLGTVKAGLLEDGYLGCVLYPAGACGSTLLRVAGA